MGAYRAMATGDIRVIDLLVCDMTHTQHSPSGALCPQGSCCVCIYNYYVKYMPIYFNANILFCILYHVIRKMQTESKSLYGTGSFVSCMGKKYFLTCCHNFFEKKDGPKLSSLSDHDLNRMITNRCRRTQFLCSTRDFRDTVALKADIVLTNHQDPVVIFDKVSNC